MTLRSARSAIGSICCLSWAIALALPFPATAQICDTLPVAVDDEVFHEGLTMVVDVLANDSEPSGEALTVTSISTTCAGTLSEYLALVSLEPALPESEECTISYQVEDEQNNTASATVFVRSVDVLFRDSFESGDTSAWVEER